MRELFHVIQYNSLVKWEIVKLVNYWQLAYCRLYNYKLETNTFLERVELVPELARCIGFLGKEIKKVTNVQGVLVRLQCVFQKEYDWSPFKLKILN